MEILVDIFVQLNEVNWDKLIKVCDDFPEQLDKAKNKLDMHHFIHD